MRFLCLLLVFLLGGANVRASLESRDRAMVVAARALLGAEIPSWRLAIRNDRRSDHYPATTHALIFAWRGGLWFYCPTDGTQSLSRFRGRVERDRAELLPLLQRIDPGFTSYRELTADEPRATRNLTPDNACFLESLAFARGLAAATPRVLRADIVSYYTELRGRRYGHSVVWYTTAEGDFVHDGGETAPARRVRLGAGASPLEFARAVMEPTRPGELVHALALPVELPPPPATMLAADRPRTAPEFGSDTITR